MPFRPRWVAGGDADRAVPRQTVTDRPTAAELLATAGALLDRRALAELGLQRRSVDYVFAQLDVIVFPGVRRSYVRSDDVRRLLDEHTFAKDQVRPT
jgi:hypothetical protein